jgi:hypothetical protein
MSSGNVEAGIMAPEPRGYERSRLNAVRHGILSRHLLLPWEDRGEYDALLESLGAEHRPNGPTEEHLVEELAGIMWRKQRLVMAEASAHRAGLHRALEKDPRGYDRVLVGALAHLDGGEPIEDSAAAIRATVEGTEAELRDLAEDEAMTNRALVTLRKGKADAYDKALAALREDTRAGWLEEVEIDTDRDDDQADRHEPEQADAADLQWYLEEEIVPWYAQRRCELENRHLIRAQAFGEALDPYRLDKLVRYEVHLDRKLERILGMLLKLQDLRRTIAPDTPA